MDASRIARIRRRDCPGFGYGPRFRLTIKGVSRIAAGLVEEGWNAAGEELEATSQAITAFYLRASAQGRVVIDGNS
ncbi:hypothetical protein Ato02nite_096130 [Paractinoplanes toevensis]|uniref:Uncharacterized protein n=1 Tax=Paractinoplanes toevensis TaxID=571911 RepID=A0A919WCR6_9ACTN|nr:hypothetical protein Ato02nite_096130 [Actinoplanes toevensis]